MNYQLTKISTLEKPYRDSSHIEDGIVITGKLMSPITVGKSVIVTDYTNDLEFRTSRITKIINDNTFQTLNSLYELLPVN